MSALASEAAARGRLKADNIAIQRARLAGVLRALFDLGGIDAVRSCTAAEIERLPHPNANDNGAWIG